MSDSTKRNTKPATALAVGGIAVACVFVVIAIVRPGALDWFLHPSDERNPRIKAEMERQKEIGAGERSKRDEAAKSEAATPMPSQEEAPRAVEENAGRYEPIPKQGSAGRYEPIPKPACISRDQVVNVIGASKEAMEGRVIGIRIASDGGRIMVAYRKKTFLGIGSGENQIEGILRRGLKNSFPDRLIKSLKVRSAGTRSVRRGADNVKAEVIEIETLQAGCRWP